MNTFSEKEIHHIVKNLDYSLRQLKAKFVLLVSDQASEGKSSFLSACSPLLADIYQRKVLIYDCQNEREDLLETELGTISDNGQFIRSTSIPGLEYLHQDDLDFIRLAPENERLHLTTNHLTEIAKDYDVVFINMKTLKRASKTTIPALPIDGAIIIRSSKSLRANERPVTSELLDREIPILGLVFNEGR